MLPVYRETRIGPSPSEVERIFFYPSFASRFIGKTDFDLKCNRVRARSKMHPAYGKREFRTAMLTQSKPRELKTPTSPKFW